MMRRLLVFLVILIASVWVGQKVIQHPGYLLISFQPWVVQMPIWFAVLAAIFILAVFYFLVTSIDRLQFAWFKVKNWLRFRREHQSYSKTQHGLALLIEGRWKKAERLLLAGAKQSIEPLMNYLGAAKAAHELKAFERSESYIKKAYVVAPKAELAIGLTQAELALAQGQVEQAVATLTYLRQQSPRHPAVLTLLEKAYVRLGDWNSLLAMVSAMRKAKLLNKEQALHLEKNLYIEKLNNNKLTVSEVNQLWATIPRYVRRNPDVVCAYVKQLTRDTSVLASESVMSKELETLIRYTLKQNWQPTLATIYAKLPLTNLNRQLVILGAWLKLYGQQPELLLALGKICVKVQLWGKAKDYFERCLALGPNPEASLEYGLLLQKLGEEQQAVEQYRLGLES